MSNSTTLSDLINKLTERQPSLRHVESYMSIPEQPNPKEFLRRLNNLRMTGTLCNAVLASKDGAKFRVHKIVMSLCSSYFKTLFTTPVNAYNHGGDGDFSRRFYLIQNASASVLETIIKYAYSGTVYVTKENVNDLLAVADELDMVEVVEECVSFMLKGMTVENCIGMWRFGRIYCMPRLENEAYRFILRKFLEVSTNSEEFLQLTVNQLKSFLNNRELNAPNELSVWTAVNRWCQYSSVKRARNKPDLTLCVRLALLQMNDFQTIMDDPKVFSHSKCRPYIDTVSKYFLNNLREISPEMLDKKTITMFTPRLPHEIILTSGGWDIDGPTTVFEAYDCRANLWKMVSVSDDFGYRAYHQILRLGDYVYIVGGCSGPDCLNSCVRLDTVNLEFREVCPMQEKRCFLSAVILNDKIYAMGGYNEYDRLRTVEYYDSNRNQWNYVSPMNEKRSDASASVLRERIFIAGGYNGEEVFLTAECYYPEFDQWLFLPPMMNCRSGLGCVTFDNALYAIGGFDGESRLNSVEKYCIFQRQWTTIRPMTKPRSNFAVAVMEKKIYVMGGYDDTLETTLDESECFDLTSAQWTTIAPLNVPRSGLAGCTVSCDRNFAPYIRDDKFRRLLKNITKEETTTLDNDHE